MIDTLLIVHIMGFLLTIAILCLIIDILLILRRSHLGLLQARAFLKGELGTHPYKLLLILGIVLTFDRIAGLLAHILPLLIDPHWLHDFTSSVFIGIFFIIVYIEHRTIKNLARARGEGNRGQG